MARTSPSRPFVAIPAAHASKRPATSWCISSTSVLAPSRRREATRARARLARRERGRRSRLLGPLLRETKLHERAIDTRPGRTHRARARSSIALTSPVKLTSRSEAARVLDSCIEVPSFP